MMVFSLATLAGMMTIAVRTVVGEEDTLQWILSDHLNSASVTANEDGTWNSSIQYTAFGEVRASSGLTETKYRYTGQLAQDVLGLDYYVARWMDPLTGHFTSADSIVPDPGFPAAFDRYSYVKNNPIRYNDPSGHWIIPVIGALVIFGAVILIPAMAQQAEVGAIKMIEASQTPGFQEEQAALNRWQNACMGQCHYSDSPGFVPSSNLGGSRPSTPISDYYNEGAVEVFNGTVGVVIGVFGILEFSVNIPKFASLSDVEARNWYLSQEARIPNLIDKNLPLEQQARQAFELRNYFRTSARNLMADRQKAELLIKNEPNYTWEQQIQRKVNQGYKGDEIYSAIISSSQKSRESVNKALGINIYRGLNKR